MPLTFEPGPGTDESRWLGWWPLDRLPRWTPPPTGKAVVLAPHPDDETLALGGVLQLLAREGWELVLVVATDGDAAFTELGIADRERLAVTRRVETDMALAELGLADIAVQRLGLPDAQLDGSVEKLAAALDGSLDGATLLLAPHHRDGHPDHEAAYAAAALVAKRHGLLLLEYPVWLWHFSMPDDPSVSWTGATRVELDGSDRARKAAAIRAYGSQLGPAQDSADPVVLTSQMLAHFARPYEVLFGTPAPRM